MKVLIADHDPAVVERLRRVVTDVGCEALTALTGAEALALVLSERPTLVIHSTNLPDLPDVELLRAIRINPAMRGTAVFVLAYEINQELIFRAHLYGSDTCLGLPINPQDLALILGRMFPEDTEVDPDRFCLVNSGWDAEWAQVPRITLNPEDTR